MTGASSGIGRAVATRFANQGWTVHNLSRRALDKEWATNHHVDLSDVATLQPAIASVAASLPGIEGGEAMPRMCVVHAAGVHTSDSIDSIAAQGEQGLQQMQQTFGVNVVAPAALTSALLPSMGVGSSIVYVGSTLSEIGVASRLSYVASKHAVVGLMRATVQDLFGRGIHTACVCPGFTDTPMIHEALTEQLGLEGDELASVRRSLEQMSSFGRFVDPAEVAELITFVADNAALNGAVLHANLGQRQS